MSKRLLAVLTGAVMIASVLIALPALAQAAAVPAEPNITDPTGDANYLNDQGLNSLTGRDGDHAGPADVSTSADIMAGWFTNDADSVTAHILVEGALPSTPSYFYRVHVDPAGGEDDCLWFQAGIPGVADAGAPEPVGSLRDICGDGSTIDGEVSLAENPDGGTIISIKIPMGTHGLAVGTTFGSPNATSRNWLRTPARSATAPQVDNTKPGTPYEITAGGPAVEEPKEEPPGKSDPPGKGNKKGCGKGKGKQKGACPGKKPGKPKAPADSCAPYVPGEMGAEAETTVVTDAATEEEPIEVDVPLGPATSNIGSDRTTRMKHNVQVDSAAADAGLWIRLEAPPLDDPDLYVYWPEGGKPAAVAGGFNPALVAGPVPAPVNDRINLNGTGSGGHSEFTAEQIDGLTTSDCQGWTLDLVNWLGRGGYTLKLWLGDAENEPAAPGAEARVAANFYDFLMSF